MARTEARYAMTGSRGGEYFMRVEFPDERKPVQLRKGGYYLGLPTCTAMVQEMMSKTSGVQSTTGISVGFEKPDVTSVGNKRAVDVDESQSSNGNSRMDSARSEHLVRVDEGIVRADEELVRAGDELVRPDEELVRSDDDLVSADDHEVREVDEYAVFAGEESNLVSLFVLPLEFSDQEVISTEVVASDISLSGKSGGLDVKLSITTWKLAFPEHGPFCILVKMLQQWVKLQEPRSEYRETAEEVFCVAKFLAFLKKEPDASEDKVRNHLLEGDVLSAACLERLRKRRALIEQYIDMDPALKEIDARKTLMSLTKEKVAGKRVLRLSEDDEDDGPPVKKPKVDDAKPEDVNMREYDSEEDFYEEEIDDADEEELGDSLCIFCDDGGYLLCCDGPCMRSFHPRRIDGINSKCKTLGFPDESDIDKFRSGWFCPNCKTKKHQCYVCGELGDSDTALGRKRDVFVCDAAACGKFYHPKCIASKLIPGAGEREAREALAKGIRAGTESFTCPLHRCKKCGQGEDKKEKDLNLATCRRCPSAWHVKCLPRNLNFEANEDSNDEIRAWLIGKLYIVYCIDHEILPHLGTPLRNHVKFKEKSSEPTSTAFKKPLTKVGTERQEFRSKASSSAVLGRSVDDASPSTHKTSEDAGKRLAEDIFNKSRHKITEESVLTKLILPSIYRRKEFNWMVRGRFDSILNGARAAIERLTQSANWEDARLKCGKDQVEAICAEENHLRTFLAPTLHGKRYTSYGRHFTKVDKLKKVVEVLQPHIRDGDTIVDFSCGDNTFSRMLHDALSSSGKPNCQFKNFDIFMPKDTFGFDRKDWLSVGVNECGPGDNLVIGLNPPFMYVDVFMSHALSMNPRVLVLIVPPMKKPVAHYGYQCMLDDPTTMAEKSFYLAGSVHGLNDENMEQGNIVPPHLYIFVRPTMPPPRANPPPPPPVPDNPSRKSEKRVIPAAAATSTDPAAYLFIPSQKRPRAPEPQRTMSRAPGFGSHVGDSEILPPPPPLPPSLRPSLPPRVHPPSSPPPRVHPPSSPPPRVHPPPSPPPRVHPPPQSPPQVYPTSPPRVHPRSPPPPRVRPPSRISQFHDQFSPGFHTPEFRPVPPHPPLDEPYSPFDPPLFSRSDPRSRDPRGFPRGGGGGFPPRGRSGRFAPRGSHLLPFRGAYPRPPPRFRDSPPRGFRDSPPRSFRDSPPRSFRDSPPRSFRDSPPRGYRDSPLHSFRDSPPRSFRDSPPRSFRDSPPRSFREPPPPGFGDLPLPPGFGEPPALGGWLPD